MVLFSHKMNIHYPVLVMEANCGMFIKSQHLYKINLIKI